MFVFNFKFNYKKILIWGLIILGVIFIGFKGIDIYKGFSANNYDYVLDTDNFTNYLKSIHDNIDENFGKTIKISGFVFTLEDFKDTNFVCGRNMILNNEEKVVGFLCEYEKAKDLAEGQWVEITGTIIPGYYMTDMPVIQVKTIENITAPINTYVEPPQDNV